jgi:hypothetical protein
LTYERSFDKPNFVKIIKTEDNNRKITANFDDISKHKVKLIVKDNYQVFPVQARSIDFVGYRFYHTHTLLRKSIKQNYARMLAKNPNHASIASYNGWLKHADCINLKDKLLYDPNQKLRTTRNKSTRTK